jgi:LysR family hydrogen peroxide-inducible transcriptional activator
MELDQLRSFVAVAESGGFTRAAQVLHSTQPTLSRQVAALEAELRQPLFDRLGRRVALTSFGQAFLERARSLLADADSLLASGQEVKGHLKGELRLGVADSVVLSRFPRILARFKRRHPDVHTHIVTGTSPDILRWVRDGKFDAGLCMLPQAHPGLALRPLWTDGFTAIVQPCHALADKRASLERFSAERQIVISPGSLSHQMLTAAYQAAGLSLVPDMDFDTFHLIAEFVAAGAGVGICSTTVAQPLLKEGRLARCRVTGISRLTRNLGLAIHADRAMGRPLAALIQEVDHVVNRPPRRRSPAGA